MRIVLALLLLLPQVALAQDAESLRARIEEHYTSINAGNEDWRLHHLPELSIFMATGGLLMEPGWEETAARMGAELQFSEVQFTMRYFSAQIYGDVGIATFYLDGTVDGELQTSRVTAVWVWRDGEWLEAHHHESRLVS